MKAEIVDTRGGEKRLLLSFESAEEREMFACVDLRLVECLRVYEERDDGFDVFRLFTDMTFEIVSKRKKRPQPLLTPSLVNRLLSDESDYDGCYAGKDGECNWHGCPQLRDNEPEKSGRHCPRVRGDDDL